MGLWPEEHEGHAGHGDPGHELSHKPQRRDIGQRTGVHYIQRVWSMYILPVSESIRLAVRGILRSEPARCAES